MGKLFLFYIIWRITGNPILAIILIVVIYYAVDRRYIGLLPSVLKPVRRLLRISQLKQQLKINPHDVDAKQDLAEAYIDSKRPRTALEVLQTLPATIQESADVLYDTGRCRLALGDLEAGESLILRALTLDNRLRYGEPYLQLAIAMETADPSKSMQYFGAFQQQNFSSCECLYRMGRLQQRLGNRQAAKEEWKHCMETYRTLPKFRRRHERRWALMARLKSMFS